MDRRRDIEKIVPLLEKDSRFIAAYALGSVVHNRSRSDSDIDIALLPVPGYAMTLLDRLRLQSRLNRHVSRPVDVGILGTDNLIYAKEAILGGTLLFCHNQTAHDLFVATALGLYAELRTARMEVEHAYTAG